MSISDLIAHAQIEFRKFRIPQPRLLKVAERFAALRAAGRLSRAEWEAKNRKGPRTPQKFLPIIGPAGSGKSTCAAYYRETIVASERHPEETKPVPHVTLSANATVKRFASDLVEEYGDPDFEEGTAGKLLRRAENHIEAAMTELLVIDEIHHLINNDNSKTAWSVTETLKRMVIRGTCPLVLIGTEQAKPLLLQNPQLKARSYPPIFLNPLDLSIADEKKMFLDHCAGFDLKLVEHKIFPQLSALIAGDIPACIYDVSRGVIGTASGVFEAAAEIALRRDGDRIERQDLSDAVQTWAIPLGITDYNPFDRGARDLKPRKPQ